MRANGWQGVTRRKKVRTTIADPDRFVRQAIRHAAQLRVGEGNPLLGNTIHRSDYAGSQYTSVRFGETLALCGLGTVGTVGDAPAAGLFVPTPSHRERERHLDGIAGSMRLSLCPQHFRRSTHS